MKQLRSSNPQTTVRVGSALRRVFGIGIPVTAALSAALAVAFAIALDGCSQQHGRQETVSLASQNLRGQSSSSQTAKTVTPAATPVVPAVTTAKPAVGRPSAVTYIDGTHGVSFRYPRKYTLSTPNKPWLDSVRLEQLPMNFVQPHGEIVAAVELAGGPAASLFRVNVEKGMTPEQCRQFAVPEAPTVGNTPVNSHDAAVAKLKVNVGGFEFSKTEFMTDKIDTRYYHHFESSGVGSDGIETGLCYEFALGVQDAADNTRPVDHEVLLDRLERIFSTVKIKPGAPLTGTAGAPPTPPTGASPQ